MAANTALGICTKSYGVVSPSNNVILFKSQGIKPFRILDQRNFSTPLPCVENKILIIVDILCSMSTKPGHTMNLLGMASVEFNYTDTEKN